MRASAKQPLGTMFDRWRAILGVPGCVAVLLVACSASIGDNPKKEVRVKEPTARQLRIARAIAAGHSYQKHVVDEKLFPEVNNREDFAELIAKVLANPTHHRELENDREAYYDNRSNTIVLYNPHARDKGTCFRPNAGLRYFKGLK